MSERRQPSGVRVRVRVRGRTPLASTAGRIRILLLALAVFFSVAGARAVQFQVIDASDRAKEAAQAMKVTRELQPLRGSLLDRDGKILAFTEATVDLVVHPNIIAGKGTDVTKASDADKADGVKIVAAFVPVIARCTGLPADQVKAKLTEKAADGSLKPYVKLMTQVGIEGYNCIQADRVTDARRNGIGSSLNWVVTKDPNPRRVYPMNTVASNVLGYMSDGKGGAGLELGLDATLTGTAGQEIYASSRNGKIPLADSTITPATNGASVTTTIDSGMCWQAQQLIDKQRADMSLEWGFTVVMEVKTGKILCLADTPSFNGNDVVAVAKSNPAALSNPAISAPFEPGSTMKMLTLATVLDAGGATPDSITHVASYADGIKSGNNTIRDSEQHGEVDYTTRGILVNSSNQGVIQLARSTFSSKGAAGKQAYIDYLTAFGLGQKSGIGLPGENPGVFPVDKILKDSYTMDSVAFGTSLSVNAVEMAAAVNAVANDGVYVAPSIIASTTGPDGVAKTVPAPVTRRVIKSTTSKDMLGMMENRVLDSYPVIGIPGVRTAAKTGTARMNNDLVMSIMGVAPAEDPQVLVYTVFFQKGSHAGAGIKVAGPVYHDIMSLAIQRYGIMPSANADQYCMLQPLQAGESPKKKC